MRALACCWFCHKRLPCLMQQQSASHFASSSRASAIQGWLKKPRLCGSCKAGSRLRGCTVTGKSPVSCCLRQLHKSTIQFSLGKTHAETCLSRPVRLQETEGALPADIDRLEKDVQAEAQRLRAREAGAQRTSTCSPCRNTPVTSACWSEKSSVPHGQCVSVCPRASQAARWRLPTCCAELAGRSAEQQEALVGLQQQVQCFSLRLGLRFENPPRKTVSTCSTFSTSELRWHGCDSC